MVEAKLRNLFFVLCFFCLWPIQSFASEINDKMWSAQDYKTQFLPNLLINGNFNLKFNEPVDDPRNKSWLQFEKCWSVLKKDSEKIGISDASGRVLLQGSSSVEIYGTLLSFKDNFKQMRDMKIIVDGLFESPSVSVRLGHCKETCEESIIPLRLEENKLVADLGDSLVGAQVNSFSLVVAGGVRTISSVVLGNSSTNESLIERDLRASEYCFKPPLTLGETSWLGTLGLVMLTLVATVLLVWLVKHREWFLSVLVSVYLSFSFFGVWVLYFGLSEYRLAQGVVDRSRILALGATNIGVLILIIGVWTLISSKNRSSLPGRSAFSLKGTFAVYVGIVLTLLCLALPNFISFMKVYLECVGPHCAVVVSQLRQDITDLGFMKPHYQRLIFYHITTLLSYFLLAGMYTANLERRYLKIVFLILFQMLILVYNGEKAPILWYLFGLLFMALSLGAVSSRKIISVILLLVAVGPTIAAVGLRFADRLSLGSLTVGYKVFEIFPSYVSYLRGKSVFDPFSMWGGSSFDLPFYQWRFIHPELLYSTIVGTSVTAFWGEAYGNFGVAGVVCAAVLFGGAIAVLYEIVSRIFSPSAAVAFISWIVFRYSVFVESLFSTLVIDFYFVGVVFLLCAALLAKRVLNLLCK
ncbi:O-antigen polymerase [Bdellovibrio bacteriovorus]|uniref:O-antigen polymerase n=1 Tax=Bdellovibrio bacteriovorus TaxID=959 RepID=UPI003D094A17